MKLGCAIYPDNHSYEVMEQYVYRIYKHDIQRVFLSLLQISAENSEQVNKYRKIVQLLKKLGIQVAADINPKVIESFGWNKDLIQHAKEFGIDILRLDNAPDLEYIVALTHNNDDIKIEINMSTDEKILDNLLGAGADVNNLLACHNFYPRKYSGLSLEHFIYMTKYFKEKGIETSAFINATSANEGPWPVSEGLCTLEDHRYQAIETQYKFYQAIGLIDNVFIANQFISEEELSRLKMIQREPLTLKINTLVELTSVEEDILKSTHVYRGDVSEYIIRSSQSRVTFSKEDIEPRYQNKSVRRGYIMIDNNLYKRYKGELHVALKEFDAGDKTNVVAKVDDSECHLLNYMKPWVEFKFETV